MIILCYDTSSRASRQAISWFEYYGIKVHKRRVEQISKGELKHILSLSETGFPEILKKPTGTGTRIHTVNQKLHNMGFEEAIDLILENKDILKVPLIFDDYRLAIGYNTDTIRTFIAKEHRRKTAELKRL